MTPILIVGTVIFTGFIFGEICTRIGLPKVTGYILAGVALNPKLTHVIPREFTHHTDLITNLALAFITFSVGGTLFFPKVRALGKRIMLITLCEAEGAFFFVTAALILLGTLFLTATGAVPAAMVVPMALLMASLASPTDPSATLAVEHEYHAEGEVTSTIMGVAAFDDILGIINYSLAMAVAGSFIHHQGFGAQSILRPLLTIAGSVLLGGCFGTILNGLIRVIRKESEGILIVLIISLLALCYGIAGRLGVDELLSTMTMGIVVVNYNVQKEKVFRILERYTEELIFVLFFTISAMNLDFSVLVSNALLIVIFVLARALGKFTGTALGGRISHASPKVQKYAAGGLIPQGGIVIGLALLIRQHASFESVSTIILNVIIGATIIHEILGPILSKFALMKAGEIGKKSTA